MHYVDEFREPKLIRKAVEEIHSIARGLRHVRIMEVCGGHTHSIFRFGLKDLLPGNIELIHGPGCPVCVLPSGRLDEGLSLANDPHVIFTAFGDMMRVPGSKGSPLECQARGADVRIVYSPLDALKVAQQNPDRQVVFFAIGFETTAPSTALTVLRARQLQIPNFAVYSNHVTIAPAIRAILDSPDLQLDAFIGPGHVSTVIGCEPYEFIARDYGCPVAVSGFEPLDLLQSLVLVLRQLRTGTATVENQYGRAVTQTGNPAALKVLSEVFEVRPTFEWRGLGSIPGSAFRLQAEFAPWDAEQTMPIERVSVEDPITAPCGDVLRGFLKPPQCPLFGKSCNPEHPIGALMVSSEGACAAHFKYVPRELSDVPMGLVQ